MGVNNIRTKRQQALRRMTDAMTEHNAKQQTSTWTISPAMATDETRRMEPLAAHVPELTVIVCDILESGVMREYGIGDKKEW